MSKFCIEIRAKILDGKLKETRYLKRSRRGLKHSIKIELPGGKVCLVELIHLFLCSVDRASRFSSCK